MLVTILFLIPCVYAFSVEPDRPVYDTEQAPKYFNDFIKTYNKHYDTENEKQNRLNIFTDNLKKINEMNANGGAVYAISKFSDLTENEFLSKYTGLIPDKLNQSSYCTYATDKDIVTGGAPAEFDWRTKNVVTPVKDQDQCGSCYAFSTIGNIESLYAIKHSGQILDLAEQQLVDCSTQNFGCNGGIMAQCMKEIIEAGGIEAESDYPYVHAREPQCKFQKSLAHVQLSGCTVYNFQDENLLKEALYSNGPIAIALAAGAVQQYTHGVITDCPGKINHAVLLVGYGTENGVDYWLIKNSWGPAWGEQGYFKIARGQNMCSLMNMFLSTAIVA